MKKCKTRLYIKIKNNYYTYQHMEYKLDLTMSHMAIASEKKRRWEYRDNACQKNCKKYNKLIYEAS